MVLRGGSAAGRPSAKVETMQKSPWLGAQVAFAPKLTAAVKHQLCIINIDAVHNRCGYGDRADRAAK